MTSFDHIANEECRALDIAAYIDGELDAASIELAEEHLAFCPECRASLNLQKQFLCRLETSLKGNEDFSLPADFTRTIVANAEGRVEGLRSVSERLNAAFISAALALFVLFAMGADVWPRLEVLAAAGDKISAVVGIAASTAYAFFVGVMVVLRNAAAPVEGFLTMALVAIALASVFMSRSLLRLSRF